MNRTIKEATVQRYHYDDHHQLRRHLDDFVAAYNFGRRLKTLKGLTPYEFICKAWQNEPDRFTPKPAPPNAGTKHLVFLLLPDLISTVGMLITSTNVPVVADCQSVVPIVTASGDTCVRKCANAHTPVLASKPAHGGVIVA
jgi:hypothetical protein